MSLNILVVDDSAVMRKMIIKTVTLSGVSVGEILEASNGAEGLETLQSHWVDLLLVDINMPVMSGEEMIRQVRENPETRDLAVIVVSTDRSASRVETLKREGAGFVHKPFSPEELRDAIIETTGVSVEQSGGSEALSGNSPDF